MVLRRSREVALAPAPVARSAAPKSLVASALRVSFEESSYNNWRFRDETWQRELWRLYDIIPEFGFAARWVGNCCSQVRIYVAKVDRLGRVQGEAKEQKVAALGDTIFGGPAAKAEALRALGINLTVAGEGYILGKTTNERDKWYILSSSEIRRVKGRNGGWDWAWGEKGNPVVLDLTTQMITRVWTPHPQRIWCADSPARSCQPVLRELEQLTKYVFSQIDSRLVGAGLLIIPNNLDFPQDSGESVSAGDSLMIRLATAGAASLRGEGTAMAVLPHIVEAAPEDVERGFKLISFASELSKQALELRAEAIRRLGLGMDMPPEVLSGLGDTNHWCMSMDTEIFTKNKGWITYDQLSYNDLAMTLNHDTGQSEWQSVEAINVFDVTNEPMLDMEGRNHSSLSTANHKWAVTQGPVRRWRTTEEGFSPGDQIPVSATNSQAPATAKYIDEFVELMAAYTSDGTLISTEVSLSHRGRPRIHLTKFKADEATEMRRILGAIYGPKGLGAWTETIEELPHGGGIGVRFHLPTDSAAPVIEVAPGKVKAIRDSFIDDLTQSQLLLLLESMINVGDGVRRGNSLIFFQVERTRLVPIERAAILLGRSVQWSLRKQTAKSFGTRPLHVLTIGQRKTSDTKHLKKKWITYTGKVWCPTTQNGTWLARRNGKVFYTGNSGFLLDGYGIKIHIEPLMNRICDALTEAYLTPALKLMGEDPARFVFAYDTSPLVLRPQRLQDALNLYEKGIIGAEAVRQEGDFKESQAPDPEESARAFIKEIMLRDPQLIQNQAIRELAGITEEMIPQTSMIMPTPGGGMGQGGPGMGPSGPPPPPAPPTGIQSELPPPMPETLGEVGAPPPNAIQASGANLRGEEMALLVLAEATVRRGLELAGKRLLDRRNRDRWPDVPHFELHTRIKVEDVTRATHLLEGAWAHIPGMVDILKSNVDPDRLRQVLARYCSILLVQQAPHEPQNLLAMLRVEGLIHG